VQRVLLRTPRTPFEALGLEKVLAEGLIAGNAGNLVFLHAAYRLLATPGTEITPDRLAARPEDAERINAEHDVYVIPFANAFRRQFKANLDRWTALISRLRIPVVILGVGAQSDLDYRLEPLADMDESVRAFVRAVLDRGPSIGVRGEFTARYLEHLGFHDVEVIGCPSVFLNGPHMNVQKKVPRLGPDARIAFNTAPSQAEAGPLLDALQHRFANLAYVAQDQASLELLILGRIRRAPSPPAGFPAESGHPLVRGHRLRVFAEPWPWIDFLRGQDFTFGSRAHGNLVSVAAGTPSYILAHDSRTLELARYFDIPHRPLREVQPTLDPATLYDEADYGPLNSGHAARWATFERYLRRHGLDHVFAAGGAEAFDERIASTAYVIPGDPAGGTLGLPYRLRGGITRRLRRVRDLLPRPRGDRSKRRVDSAAPGEPQADVAQG
jgi:hypothetical protein